MNLYQKQLILQLEKALEPIHEEIKAFESFEAEFNFIMEEALVEDILNTIQFLKRNGDLS
jgi:hypothetical protein